MCTMFWMLKVYCLLQDYMLHKVTVTGLYFNDLLHKVCVVVKEKCWGNLTKVPLLLHDNAPAHRSHAGHVALLESGFEEISHPPYYPNLEPSDCHRFPNSKKHLYGQRFSIIDELKYATEEWLKEQSEIFYFTGIQKLWDHYKLCIDTSGEYVEK